MRPLQRLIPPTAYDEPLPYFIYAGLVFVPFVEPCAALESHLPISPHLSH